MNAKKEFLDLVGNSSVRCAKIEHGRGYVQPVTYHILPVNFTSEEYKSFLESLDFDYNDSYGRQRVFGTVWFEDGTWAERGEYDGSEWWEHRVLPEIPMGIKE